MILFPIRYACLLSVLGPGAVAQVTVRASVGAAGQQANSSSDSSSIRGHFVAFVSGANNLVGGDTNNFSDVFLHDLLLRTTVRVSLGSAGAQADGSSGTASVSLDGRFVAFDNNATNLVAGGSNTWLDVFVRDRLLGTTELVSVDTAGVPGNDSSQAPSISADGRLIVFTSGATNLVPGDTNNSYDVFVRDRLAGTTTRASVSSSGVQGDQGSAAGSVSDDGRYVVFAGASSNLAAGGSGFLDKVFLRDLLDGTTELASVNSANQQANWHSNTPSVSGNGRFVAFESGGSNLVSGDTNGASDIFVRDRQNAATERVSISSSGAQSNSDSYGASISGDGRWVAFWSTATNLVAGDTNGFVDIFVHDRQTGITERVSVNNSAVAGNNGSRFPKISGDGRYVAFYSEATNLVTGDTNAQPDIFVRDRSASGFSSECHAGTEGIASCPCGNPPDQPGLGCNNSSGTGGAQLSASGAAYLSDDHLRFSTSGEGPSALSIVMQGNGEVPTGLVFGQGLRCLGGTVIRRLFIKQAVGGSILAPDPNSGDPSVSAQSALRGDIIHAGESRWYLVYYRDPLVLGSCPSASTFNATQTGRVIWTF